MKKIRLLLPLLCLLLALSACGGGTTPTEPVDEPQDAPEQTSAPEREMDPEDVARLEGSWTCTGVMRDGKLVMFSDVPALADLYDQTLFINANGTYTFLDVFSHRGQWSPMGSQPFEGFDYSYLFSKQYDVSYSLDENNTLTTKEEASSEAYIVSVSESMPDTLVWLEKNDGEAVLFLYQRDKSGSTSSAGSTPTESSPAAPSTAPSASTASSATLGERNALAKAKDYLDVMAFSYNGLVEQLEFEGYLHSEAVYGADHCGADWNEQAARKAADYLDLMPFSRADLIGQLEFEGFTHAQAVYGAERNGY